MSSSFESEPPVGRRVADRASSRHRRARRLMTVALGVGLVLAAWSSAAQAFTLKVTGPANAPEMVFNNQMKVVQVCLPVTNPTGGQSVLYGQRFTDGATSPLTPAIVLVHGIASSTENWDFSPTWSVARALASAGYVVFSYDRLGYAERQLLQPARRRATRSPPRRTGDAARRRRRREDRRLRDQRDR